MTLIKNHGMLIAVYASRMASERYDIEGDSDGTWSVIDTMTGLPYEIGALALESMPFWLALDLVGFLNEMDRQRKRPH
ncbi:hypothetical protein [Mesorhizobium sp. SP-1A]|uniref:hypothetical protein n=1 Tax=Mesorhizobium sp. SP-1A TaxID=3077840 RepID=UPI0028F74ECE|nr:hypothetical protein [Mesorhizobium sp. SP-1A]